MGSTFTFRLEQRDGKPTDPPTIQTTILNWRVGDPIHLGRRTLRVVETQPGAEPDDDPVLVVEEDTAGRDAA